MPYINVSGMHMIQIMSRSGYVTNRQVSPYQKTAVWSTGHKCNHSMCGVMLILVATGHQKLCSLIHQQKSQEQGLW